MIGQNDRPATQRGVHQVIGQRLRAARRALGYRQSLVARALDVKANTISAIERGVISARTAGGAISRVARQYAIFLGLDPNELWPPRSCLCDHRPWPMVQTQPDEALEAQDRSEAVYWALSTLDPIEQEVLTLRYGLWGADARSINETASILRRMGAVRVRAIERKALRKLRRPRRTWRLRPFADIAEDAIGAPPASKRDPLLGQRGALGCNRRGADTARLDCDSCLGITLHTKVQGGDARESYDIAGMSLWAVRAWFVCDRCHTRRRWSPDPYEHDTATRQGVLRYKELRDHLAKGRRPKGRPSAQMYAAEHRHERRRQKRRQEQALIAQEDNVEALSTARIYLQRHIVAANPSPCLPCPTCGWHAHALANYIACISADKPIKSGVACVWRCCGCGTMMIAGFRSLDGERTLDVPTEQIVAPFQRVTLDTILATL